MFTKTFTLEQHVEELRVELRGTVDAQEACEIRAELEGLLAIVSDRQRDDEAA